MTAVTQRGRARARARRLAELESLQAPAPVRGRLPATCERCRARVWLGTPNVVGRRGRAALVVKWLDSDGSDHRCR